jgi:uncharacterized membrane protein HdeD (DUF308 family)
VPASNDIWVFGLPRRWWSITVRGVAAVSFGLTALLAPRMSLALLVFLFGVYSLVDGSFNPAAALRSHDAERHWVALLVEAVVSIVTGVVVLVWPGITPTVLLVLIGLWVVATGVLELAASLRLSRHLGRAWFLGLGGVVSVAFGVLLLSRPDLGTAVLMALLGGYTVVFGALLVILGLRLRRMNEHRGTRSGGGRLVPLPVG